MDREIKFRGKDLNLDVWRYGDLLQYNDGDVCIGEHDLHWTDDGFHCNTYGQITHVYEDTIGQYIGIKDKNGVEIYEGDIVIEKIKRSRKYGERLVVCFEEFEWKGKNANGATTSLSLLAEYHTIEIVGNIHDNPELIKKEGQQ